jgi:hypothetical protein
MKDPGVLVIAIPWLIGGLPGAFAPQVCADIHRNLFGPIDGWMDYCQNAKIIRKVSCFMLAVASVLVIIHFAK